MELLPYKELMRALRKKRKRLDITQKKLADRAGISNAQLNRMEHGNVEATYSTVYRVWEVLKRVEEPGQTTAGELCSDTITWVRPEDTCVHAKELMLENDFSQLPVRAEGGDVVGSVTNSSLIDVDDPDRPVGEVLTEPFPAVSSDTGRDVIEAIFRDGSQAILVTEEGDYCGIITKADLL
jgi:predicted transcriptional regulator